MPVHKYRPYPYGPDLPDRTWPDADAHAGPDLVLGRPARRKPGAHRPDGRRRARRRMWDLLVRLGFKEIEVGFPSASQPDYDFTRLLIEEDLVPDDVWIQVLDQCAAGADRADDREPRGAKRRSSTSTTRPPSSSGASSSGEDRAGIIEDRHQRRHAVPGALDRLPETEIRFEYSPESFTGTEPDFALEICEQFSTCGSRGPTGRRSSTCPRRSR